MRKLIAALLLMSFAALAHASAGIFGTISSASTGQPLPGATVSASSGCLLGLGVCSAYGSTVSDQDGRFNIQGLDFGNGWITASFQPGEANYAPVQIDFVLNDGEQRQQDLQLELGGTIEGTIRLASDQSTLSAIPLTLLSGDLSYNVSGTSTDASGHYAIQQLRAGSYALRTDHAIPYQDRFYAGHSLTPPSQGPQLLDVITLTPGQTVTADFALVVGGQVEGVITDRYTGLPIANASQVEFQIYDANDTSAQTWVYEYVNTDAVGGFVLSGLPDAPVHIGAYIFAPYYAPEIVGCSPDPCADVANGTVFTALAGTHQTVNFSMFPGAVITGKVTRRSNGQPLQGVTVSAYLNSYFVGQLLFATTSTDASGNYVLSGGLSDQVYVSATKGSSGSVRYIDQVYQNHNCVQGNCATVGDLIDSPSYQVTSKIDFKLDVGATISGRAIRSDTGTGYQAFMMLFADDGSLSTTFVADSDGYFTTDGLQPGTYYLQADGQSLDYGCVVYPNLPCSDDPRTLNPDAGAIVVTGLTDVTSLLFVLPSDTIFGSGFD